MLNETILERQANFFAENRLNWDIDYILDHEEEYIEKIKVLENIFTIAYNGLTQHMETEAEKENFLIHNGAKVVELANKMLV